MLKKAMKNYVHVPESNEHHSDYMMKNSDCIMKMEIEKKEMKQMNDHLLNDNFRTCAFGIVIGIACGFD